jgi:hypothetical protein
MVNPETGNVKPILMAEECWYRFESRTQNYLVRRVNKN